MSEKFSKIISIISVLFLLSITVFMVGLKVGKSQTWPYDLIDQSHKAILSLLKFGEVVQTNRIIEAPKGSSRERFTIYQSELIQPGFYAFMGFDGKLDKYLVWLLDEKGRQIHSWKIVYESLDPVDRGRFTSPHALKILPDGSLLVSFDSGNMLARVDQCSQPIWKKNGVFHHSIEKSDDGSYWAWRGSKTAYGHYNYLTNFDPKTGKTLKELGLIEDIIQKDYKNAIRFGLRNTYPFKEFSKTPRDKRISDLFHPNDIDILPANLADKFPLFNAGDLLISLRNTSLVAVLDSNTGRVKWSANGPWRYQHDPDFSPDGFISIYDNNTGFARSEIIRVNPNTGEIENLLTEGNLNFYSETQGKHQYLPNGNLLLVNPDEGRALQVTSTGDKVFEFNNVSSFSSQYNEHLANGMWLSPNYFESIPSCNE